MSDIHILSGKYRKNGSGSISVIYHVPNSNNKYPGGDTSELTEISQLEIDALLAGRIVEVKKNINVNKNQTQVFIKNKIAAIWDTVATRTQNKINNEYALYGTTLARNI